MPAVPARPGPLGPVLVAAASVLFAANGVVAKLAMHGGLAPTRLVELRCLGSAVLLGVVVLAVAPRSLRLTRREVAPMALLGVVGMALVQWLYLVAIDRLPVGLALLLEYTAPLMVALWARFVLREAIHPRVWLALGLALGGLALVAQVGSGLVLDPLGLAAALGSAVCLACYYLLADRLLRGRPALATQTWSLVFAAAFWLVLQPLWTLDAGTVTRDVGLPSALGGEQLPTWALVIWVIVLGTVVPYGLAIAGLARVGPARAGLIGMVEPAAAGVFAWVALGEAMTAVQVAGAVVVLVGVALAESARRRPATVDGSALAAAVPPAPTAGADMGR